MPSTPVTPTNFARKTLLALAALLALAMAAPAAAAGNVAENFVTDNIHKGLELLNNKQLSAPQKREEFESFLLGLTDMKRCFEEFRPSKQRYGIIFIISDFFGREIGSATEAVARVAAWPGENHFLQIVHPDERQPEIEGELELTEVETGERRWFWLTKRDVQRYVETFDAFVGNLASECASHSVYFMQVTSDEAFEELFLDLLVRGSALAGGA